MVWYKRTHDGSQETWVHNLNLVTDQLTFLNLSFPIHKMEIEPDDLQGPSNYKILLALSSKAGSLKFLYFILFHPFIDSTNIYSTKYCERHRGRQTCFSPSQNLQFGEGEKTAN